MTIKKRKDIEIASIRKANRACAVGNLMLGKLKNWQEFLTPDTDSFESFPRRNLRAGSKDVKKNLSKEINLFCRANFINMDINILEKLFEVIKSKRGLSIPLSEFERKYAQFKKNTLKGVPSHATVNLSLWGLQFKFPEDFFSKDICEAIQIIKESEIELKNYSNTPFSHLKDSREKISRKVRKTDYAIRTSFLSCFNLLESFLNGLAWEFCQDPQNLSKLSATERKLLRESSQVSFKNKLFKYPKIISQQEIDKNAIDRISEWIDFFKPFRDSLAHPSPFNAPEKFGGYDKLQNIYSMDPLFAFGAAATTFQICETIYLHIFGDSAQIPDWLNEFKEIINSLGEITKPE